MENFVVAEGKWSRLRPVLPTDIHTMYLSEVGNFSWWRLRGRTPSPAEYAEIAWRNVLEQYIVETVDGSTPLGFVLAYNADFRNDFVYLGLQRFDLINSHHAAVFFEAVALFLERLFLSWPFRKIYFETDASIIGTFASVMRFATEESRLSEHIFRDGQYVDQLTLAVSRSSWVANRSEYGL